MATMRDIVEGAAKRLGIIRAGEALEAADASDMLEALNDMLAAFEAKGINILWSGALALGGTVPLDAKHDAGLKAMLAERVAEDFGMAVTAKLDAHARAGWAAVNADYRLPDQMHVDLALANMPSQRRVI